MPYDDLITFFETIVSDSPDSTAEAVLAETAYAKRNDARMWSFLLKLDSSITHPSSDAWNTAKTLPTDFDDVVKLFVGASDNEYEPIPYESILSYQGASNRFAIDYAVPALHFPSGGDGSTVYLWYKYLPTSLIGLTDAQKALATTIVWPKRFVPIIAYDMAQLYVGGIDADDIGRQQAPFYNAAHKELFNAMIAWDTRRRMKMFDNNSSPLRGRGGATASDVVDMP